MQSQRYRHVITFQRLTGEQDEETGETPRQWENVPGWEAVRAEALPGPGDEQLAADSKHSRIDARFNFRYRPGLDPAWRILWDGNYYDIIGPSADRTSRREIRLTCEAGASEGF